MNEIKLFSRFLSYFYICIRNINIFCNLLKAIPLTWFFLVSCYQKDASRITQDYCLLQKPYHAPINSQSHDLRMVPKRYFRFHWNYKQPHVAVIKSMLNCEILFSQIRPTILKIFTYTAWFYSLHLVIIIKISFPFTLRN